MKRWEWVINEGMGVVVNEGVGVVVSEGMGGIESLSARVGGFNEGVGVDKIDTRGHSSPVQ